MREMPVREDALLPIETPATPSASDAEGLLLDDNSLSLLYQQIHDIARRFRSTGFFSDSIGATDLAHESLVRILERLSGTTFDSPRHLLNTASQVMHRLLVDRLRRRKLRSAALREIADATRDLGITSLEDDALATFADELDLLDERRPRAAEVLRYRFFFRMTLDEIAREMGWGLTVVRQELSFARAYLTRPGHLFEGHHAVAPRPRQLA